jgi:transposase
MPRGKFVSREQRELVWHQRRVLERTPREIWKDVFQGKSSILSLRYTEELCRQCDSGNKNALFIGCKIEHKGGPKLKLDPIATGHLLDIWVKRKQTKQSSAVSIFANSYYGGMAGAPSVRTIGRVLKRNKFTRKKLERVHYLRDDIKRANYLNNVAPFHFATLVNIDETLSTPKEFLIKYGYNLRGKIAEKTQFKINDKHYSAIVAYSPLGVLAYKIVEGTIDNIIFESFVENELANSITPNMIGLFDNAKIHHTQIVRETLNRVFNGNYLFAAPYSADLMPVERLFSVVKNELREIEDQVVLDPIRYLSECFDRYLPGGPKAGIARNHFRLYRDNHNAWLARF